MAVKLVTSIKRFIGTAAEMAALNVAGIPVGSTFFTSDEGLLYVLSSAGTWAVKKVSVGESALPLGAATSAKQDALAALVGALADAAVTDPTASGSEIALLKGIIKQLQGDGTAGKAAPVTMVGVEQTNGADAAAKSALVAGKTAAGKGVPLLVTDEGKVELNADVSATIAEIEGKAAHDAAASGNPVQIGGVYRATDPNVADGDAASLRVNAKGEAIVQLSGSMVEVVEASSIKRSGIERNVSIPFGVKGVEILLIIHSETGTTGATDGVYLGSRLRFEDSKGGLRYLVALPNTLRYKVSGVISHVYYLGGIDYVDASTEYLEQKVSSYFSGDNLYIVANVRGTYGTGEGLDFEIQVRWLI